MKTAVAKALPNSHSYSGYRKLVSDLVLEGKSSGNEQSEDLTHYSTLNETRMNRLEKTISVAVENIEKLQSLKNEYIWLVLAEGWCGDAAQLLPIFNKMAAVSDNIELKVVFRDENEELMNHFLTNGSKSIPKLIVLDKETLNIEANWGPRPKGASDLIKNYKEKFGLVDETAKTDLQLWYLHDKGLGTQKELVTLMLDLEL
ncbi:thioredoxin family protein [Flavobacterium sp.]|uniref:thioredoxin family protein n=1 Tax=Flavobacterium sp. TaxID=239 RepID=UPI002B4B2F6E|nr:thioredoxin family protein [Flavobacterium sp.]HLF51705.1 thioredoxin family protein [Flavobacterium sp.]